MKLDLFSERYAATGNLASEGVRNQLGRPRLDPIAVLIREAVQNSWDAHDPTDPHIDVRVELRTVDPPLLSVLRDQVLACPAPETPMRERLRGPAGDMTMLVISDRNTSGLGGPTRADVISHRPDEPEDFVDFLRNIGQPPDSKDLGGGTFGYGKAALYRMSRLRTILVDTVCRHRDRDERRFIGACLGSGYEIKEGPDRGRYTGRHWWGRLDAAGEIAEPLRDDEAAAISDALGLPGFDDQQRGTTIAIPDFGYGLERTPTQHLQLITEAILWNFWPKMVPGRDGRPAIRFSLWHDGARLPVPDPREWPPLDGFCHALEALDQFREGGESAVTNPMARGFEVWNQRPRRLLGHAAFVRMMNRPWTQREEEDVDLGHLRGARSHHTAWMRDPRLIVRYDEGPAPLGDLMDWAGVYVVAREHDRAYAEAEPPTHDDWVPGNIEDRLDKMAVNVGIRRVREHARAFAAPDSGGEDEARSEPLGALSRNLGGLLTGHVGRGADREALSGKKTTGPQLVEDEEEIEAFFGEESAQGEIAQGETDAGAAREDAADLEVSQGHADDPGQDRAVEVAPRPPGRPRITTRAPSLEVVSGEGCLVVPFRLRHGVRSEASSVTALLKVEIDGREVEKAPPAGASTPQVLGWRDPRGGFRRGEATLEIEEEGEWAVVVRLIDEAPVRVRLRGVAVQQQR